MASLNSEHVCGRIRTVGSSIADLIYPRVCGVCASPMGGDVGQLCWDCIAGFVPVTRPFCERCGDPIVGIAADGFTCSICRRQPPSFTLARSAFRHRRELQEALIRFKYAGGVELAESLGGLLFACVKAHYADIVFDTVLPVPLHTQRARKRTYNQSALLARNVSKRMGLPYRPHKLLRRVRNTSAQTGLNAHQRSTNVRDAFHVDDPTWVVGRVFLLVDDVMTTGATVGSAAEALQKADAAAVYVVTVARG